MTTMRGIPTEIFRDIVDYCDATDVTHLLCVSRHINSMCTDIVRQRGIRLVADGRGLLLRCFSPDSEIHDIQWFCSCGAHVSATHIQLYMRAAERASKGVALDIDVGGYFGHIVLQVYFALAEHGNRPLAMSRVALRISVEWAQQDSVLVERNGLQFALRVERESKEPFRNKFGETVHRYRVGVLAVRANTNRLLAQVEQLRGSSVLLHMASPGHISVVG